MVLSICRKCLNTIICFLEELFCASPCLVSCKCSSYSFHGNILQALSAAMKETCPNVTHVTCSPHEIKNLRRIKPAELQASEVDVKLFIPFDVHVYDDLKDTDVNFRFVLQETPYYPSYLCKYHASVYHLDAAPTYCCVCFSGNALTAVNNYLSNNSSTNNTMRIVDKCSEERRKEAEEDKKE